MGKALKLLEEDRRFEEVLRLADSIKRNPRIKHKWEYLMEITGQYNREEWEVMV